MEAFFMTYDYLTGRCRENRVGLFSQRHTGIRRGNRQLGSWEIPIRSKKYIYIYFSVTVVKYWNICPDKQRYIHPWRGSRTGRELHSITLSNQRWFKQGSGTDNPSGNRDPFQTSFFLFSPCTYVSTNNAHMPTVYIPSLKMDVVRRVRFLPE